MTVPPTVTFGLVAAAGVVVAVSRRGGGSRRVPGAARRPEPGGGRWAARPARTPRSRLAVPARSRPLGGGRADGLGARWATRRELGELRAAVGEPGRLVLGTVAGPGRALRRTVLAAEPSQSVAVVGPTQSGKTSSLAIPAILSWEGPVVAASVKTDLARDTWAWRCRRGRVWCFDPTRATGLPSSRWSPLPAARTWAGARRVASHLTEVARGFGTTADGEFWYATAAKLLAPLLFAAANAGLGMGDVVRWVDTQEIAEVADILEQAGVPDALRAARATWLREERQRSSVYTTAETVLEPFADPDGTTPRTLHDSVDTPPQGVPAIRAAVDPGDIDPGTLLLGTNTLYLCAPAHDQRRLRGLFTALVEQVLEVAFTRSARLGAPLSPPLLVVLDEAANIAPLVELDGLAATCAGHGVQLVTVWQDLAQVAARYGERASTVINNHRAKLFLSGTADPRTLDHASHLVGEEEVTVPTVTRGPAGERSVTASPIRRRLLPADSLRRLPPGTGVLVYGSLPPVRLTLRPWFGDPVLAERGNARPAPVNRRADRGRG